MNNTSFLIWNIILIVLLLITIVLFIIQGCWCVINSISERKERRNEAKRLWDENVKIRVRIRRTDHWDRIIHQVFQDKTAQDYELKCFEEMLNGGYLVGADGSSCRMMYYISEEED